MSFDFDLSRLLQTIGPTASLLFAAWIFLQYLNQRYIEAVQRLREITQNLRVDHPSERRKASLCDQLKIYQQRCSLMQRATNVGLVAALSLTSTLVMGALVTVSTLFEPLSVVGTCCAIVGLLLVMVAAAMVIVENHLIGKALRSETTDLG